MDTSIFQKLKSLLPRPASFQVPGSSLEQNPVRLVTRASLALTTSVTTMAMAVVAFTGREFVATLVPAVILAPFLGAAFGCLITIHLQSSGQAPAPCRKHTVLLLEAEPNLRQLIEEGLTNAGFHLICVRSAKHAAHICRDHGGLLDLLLANTNALGGRSIDCLRTITGSLTDLPVLIISPYDRQSLSKLHPDLLASYEFLPLPIEFPHLAETIETLLLLGPQPTALPR